MSDAEKKSPAVFPWLCVIACTNAAVAGDIDGVVQDYHSGKGVSAIQVQLIKDKKVVIKIKPKTSMSGAYGSKDIPDGDYELSIDAPSGYTVMEPAPFPTGVTIRGGTTMPTIKLHDNNASAAVQREVGSKIAADFSSKP